MARSVRRRLIPKNFPKIQKRLNLKGYVLEIIGAPYGNRTRVSALRGPRPRPLDEGSVRFGIAPMARARKHSHWSFRGAQTARARNPYHEPFRRIDGECSP